jgi:hypothetical protein
MAFSRIGKRESITSTGKHPSGGVLARHILGIQAIFSYTDTRNPIATAVATLIRAQVVHTHLSIEFAIRRGRWRRHCVECAFYSYTRVGS